MDHFHNERLAAETGLSLVQVEFLRSEFVKMGRNPMVESVEIIAIENGIDEQRATNLLQRHTALLRKMDGLADQFKAAANSPITTNYLY